MGIPIDSSDRKRKGENVWERDRKETCWTADDLNYAWNYGIERPNFSTFNENMYLDVYTKRAALLASPAVVSLVSFSGNQEVFQASGTIIESNDTRSVILTSASLIRRPGIEQAFMAIDDAKVFVYLSSGASYQGTILARDIHYNLAVIEIVPDARLPVANLRCVDESMTLDPRPSADERTFQLRSHSNLFNLVPGDMMVALGRYFIKPFDLMGAPGEFSLRHCPGHECKELFRSTCTITRCGTGGPVINRHGDVIGISFYDMSCTPFLPINIISKWWEHYKQYRDFRRPCLGMEVTNLYAAELQVVEKIVQQFPDTSKGVIVDEVIPGSSADSVGILPNDVIIRCGGKTVCGFLELFEIMWDKVGNSVQLVVVRAGNADHLYFTVRVVETAPDKFYR